MFWKRKPKKLTNREKMKLENQNNFEKRMRAIIHIANKNMKKAKYGTLSPVRDTVVIKYDDLLKIWDIAERAKSDTMVV